MPKEPSESLQPSSPAPRQNPQTSWQILRKPHQQTTQSNWIKERKLCSSVVRIKRMPSPPLPALLGKALAQRRPHGAQHWMACPSRAERGSALPSGWASVSVSKWWRRNFSCSGVWGREPLDMPDTSGRVNSSVVPGHSGERQRGLAGENLQHHESWQTP